MLLFETRLKFLQYFLSALGCFYCIPISFFAFNSINLILNSIGIISWTLGILQFSYTLKTFHLYDDCLIVRRPMFFLNPNTTFDINKIDSITFRQVTGSIGAGNYLIVFSNKTEKDFMLIYSGKTLKEFIAKLKEVGIATTQEFRIE